MGVCGPSVARCGLRVTLAPRALRLRLRLRLRGVTYLSAHLCLRVCARFSTFAPYHGVLMFLPLYLFVCCLLLRRCTPYANGVCEGGGPPSYSSPCSLVARGSGKRGV